MTTPNESEHYAEGDSWALRAEQHFHEGEFTEALAAAAIASAHFAGSQAADHDRIADCVPDGASRFSVAVAGR